MGHQSIVHDHGDFSDLLKPHRHRHGWRIQDVHLRLYSVIDRGPDAFRGCMLL